MKRNRIMIALLLGMLLFGGCTANTQQAEETWVKAEQITYDENGDITNRQVYEYDGSERNFRAHLFNGDNEEYGYTDVVENKDGTERTETYYVGDNSAVFAQTEYAYREDGKPLSEKQIAGNGTVTRERIWNWNDDGTAADVLENGEYSYTVEYDEQGREIRSYNDKYETVFTYEEQGKVLRTSYMDNTRVEYVVQTYDAQGRTIETLNYELDEDRAYTEEDIAARSTCEYDEDGHSYVVTSVYEYGTFSIQFIYKPLSELLK